jgi:hypothetical protein
VENEEWRSFNERYDVSSLGRIRSNYSGTWKILNPKRTGTCQYLNIHYGKKSLLLHRMVAEAFGIIKDSEIVNHIDGNKLNNAVSNLEKSNHSHNMAHAHRTGLRRQRTGEMASGCKLTDKQAIEIIKSISLGRKFSEVGKEYKIAAGTAKGIARGWHWKHLDHIRLECGVSPERRPSAKSRSKFQCERICGDKNTPEGKEQIDEQEQKIPEGKP